MRSSLPFRRGVTLVPLFALAAISGMCTQPAPPTVVVTLATNIPNATVNHIRLRGVQSWDPLEGGVSEPRIDLTYDLGDSSAQVMLPQSFGLEPTGDQPAIAVIDNSDSNIPDDPNAPPTIRRVVRVTQVTETSHVLVFLNEDCLATVRPTGSMHCPGNMPNCTMSQFCEAQGSTCGNDGCCRSIDLQPSDLVPGDAGIDATAPPSGCSMPADAGTDAPTDSGRDATDVSSG